MTGKRNIKPKQQAVIGEMVAGASVAAAAKATGANERTIRRWIADDAFAEALTTARAEAWSRAMNRLRGKAERAVEVLAEMMDSPGAPPHARIRAALGVIRHARQLVEVDELVARVEALERSLIDGQVEVT